MYMFILQSHHACTWAYRTFRSSLGEISSLCTVRICYDPIRNLAHFEAGWPDWQPPARFTAGWPEAAAGLILQYETAASPNSL